MIRKIPKETECFHFYNANPKGNRAADCVIRAIATATGKKWDDVLKDLTEIALEHKVMPDERKCYEQYLKDLGWKKHKQPRKYDNTKYTGSEFCEFINEVYNSENPVIAGIGGHHIVCIKDFKGIHKVVDTWDSTKGCIGNYWTKDS